MSEPIAGNLPAWISLISSSIALLTTIFILFGKFAKAVKKFANKSEALEALPERLDAIDKTLGELKKETAAQFGELTRENAAQGERIEQIEADMVGNELDRLKHVIFEFGNRARKRDKISGEEFRYLQQVYDKYASKGGNGIAHDEYEFIKDCYNDQEV